MPEERRQHTRRHVDLPAEFDVGDGQRRGGRCADLSLGGMYLQTPDPPAFGGKVRVFIPVPTEAREMAIDGVVRWTKPDGVGVQFGVMGARDTYELSTYLSKIKG